MTMRRDASLLAVAVAILLVSGCATRSISDSGYDRGSSRHRSPANLQYQGELSEFDVLGIDRGKPVSEQEIQQVLDTHQRLSIKRGSAVMLIQSGAMIPDEPMIRALEKYYTVGIFTGVPGSARSASGDSSAESYSKTLRLAAAKGGYEKLIVYWGLLETAQENLATRTVSWVPVVGWVLPDQRQRMRIRLKVAVVDVRSGSWETIMPTAFDDSAFSAILSREASDQSQVALLKDKAYVAAAEEVLKRYGR